MGRLSGNRLSTPQPAPGSEVRFRTQVPKADGDWFPLGRTASRAHHVIMPRGTESSVFTGALILQLAQ